MSDGAICDGGDRFERRSIQWCPVCKGRRRFYGYFQHWYGWSWHCLGCGDRWSGDGEMGPRPFERGWRAKAIRQHREWWDAAPRRTTRESKAAFLAFVRAYFEDAA